MLQCKICWSFCVAQTKQSKPLREFEIPSPNFASSSLSFLSVFPSMKWDMEIEEIEAVLEKIWDIHDKLSEAIHSISRDHFLTSTKNLRKSQNKDSKTPNGGADDNPSAAFPFLKEFRIDIDDSAIQEARSLNAIRTALENLEDQLEFLHVC